MLPRVGRRGGQLYYCFQHVSHCCIYIFVACEATAVICLPIHFLFCFVFFHNFKQFFISNYRTSGYLLSTAQVHVAMLRAVKAASVVEPPPLTLPQNQVNSQITLELFGVGVNRVSRNPINNALSFQND